MRIDCPFCGERDLHEFTYQGDASVRRPDAPAGDDPDETLQDRFVDALHYPENPAGLHEGLWLHRYGCGSWLKIRRDTRTHEILSVSLAKPETTR
jgi:methylglutamate dehydrogenase subunit B